MQAIIPVRVPSDSKPILATDRSFDIRPDHPLYSEYCPVCAVPLGLRKAVLVVVGIEPSSRKEYGFCTGAAVAVHSDCAGYEI